MYEASQHNVDSAAAAYVALLEACELIANCEVAPAVKDDVVPADEPEQVGKVRLPMLQVTPAGQQPRKHTGVKG